MLAEPGRSGERGCATCAFWGKAANSLRSAPPGWRAAVPAAVLDANQPPMTPIAAPFMHPIHPETQMKILLPVDGSDYTKRMLSYIAAHDELLGGATTETRRKKCFSR
jgi:hypothetical protein